MKTSKEVSHQAGGTAILFRDRNKFCMIQEEQEAHYVWS